MKAIKFLAAATLMLVAGSTFAQDTIKVLTPKNTRVQEEILANKRSYTYVQNANDTIFTDHRKKSTITINYGKQAQTAYRKAVKKDHWAWHEGHYMGVNIHYNGLTNTEGSPIALDTKAIGVDINLIDLVIFSYRRFGIITGLGIESNNFRFRDDLSLKVDENRVTVPDYQYVDAGINLQKSKLTTTYLNIPLLFQFKLGNSSQYGGGGWFNLGVVAGLRLQSYTKVKLPDGTKIKNFNDFNMRNIHWGAMASFGYSFFTITAKYYPQSIFRAGQGPNTEQFNFGFGVTF